MLTFNKLLNRIIAENKIQDPYSQKYYHLRGGGGGARRGPNAALLDLTQGSHCTQPLPAAHWLATSGPKHTHDHDININMFIF